MDSYCDLRVLPDPEFSETLLMNALVSKFHRALVAIGHGQIGISFPKHNRTLGNILRIHGKAHSLNSLAANNWIKGLKDYVEEGDVLTVPATCHYRLVSRFQSKTAHNKRRRSVLKGWVSEQEALRTIPDTQQKTIELPYVQMRSATNKNPFRLYIQHGEVQAVPMDGEFSSYGLSRNATIPWF